MEPEQLVFDSYAMLAFLMGESGQERIQDILHRASRGDCQIHMSIINVGEVLYITERRAGLAKLQDVLSRIGELPIEIVDADRVQTLAASHLKAHWPIAYADCFAIALARTKGATIVTGDPEFKQVQETGVAPVEFI